MTDTPLHLVLLEFADTSGAAALMDDHNRWIDRGFDDGTFLLTGSVPGRGGAVLLHGVTGDEVDRTVQDDPFVLHGVVTPTVVEIQPSRLAPGWEQLIGG